MPVPQDGCCFGARRPSNRVCVCANVARGNGLEGNQRRSVMLRQHASRQ